MVTLTIHRDVNARPDHPVVEVIHLRRQRVIAVPLRVKAGLLTF